MKKESFEYAFQIFISEETHGLKMQKNWYLKTETTIQL